MIKCYNKDPITVRRIKTGNSGANHNRGVTFDINLLGMSEYVGQKAERSELLRKISVIV